MKKIYLLFILFIPFLVKAELRELQPVKEYNTGYAYSYYIDGYIYGVNGRAENNYIEKMTIEGETIYKIERTITSDYCLIYNDGNYFYIIDLDPLSENYYYDVYVYKYDLKTGEKVLELKLENYFLMYINDSIIVNNEKVRICSNLDECTLIDLDTFDTTEGSDTDLEIEGQKIILGDRK